MMFVILFGLILGVFWFRATRLDPQQFPHAKPGDVLAWQSRKIQLYRRYAALLIIDFFLGLGYQLLAGFYERSHGHLALLFTYLVVALYLSLTVFLLVYTALHAYRNYRWKQANLA